MINKKKAAILVAALAILAVAAIISQGAAEPLQAQQAQTTQQAEVRPTPVVVGQPMPDFTLPVYQGGTLTLSSLRGKNVLILFPRGYAAKDYWCTICNYRYVELAEIEKAQKIREEYNVEVLVVFPYAHDIVKLWLEALPGQLEIVRNTKNPADPSKLDENGKRRMERFRQLFPADYSLEKGTILAPFPILVKGRAFGSPLARGLYPQASTAEVDPRASPGPRPLSTASGSSRKALDSSRRNGTAARSTRTSRASTSSTPTGCSSSSTSARTPSTARATTTSSRSSRSSTGRSSA